MMRIVYKAPRERGPRAPWRTAFIPVDTIAERDGWLWRLEHREDSQGGYKVWTLMCEYERIWDAQQ